MFESLCSLPLTSDVFAQALHPTTSVVAVGLTSGHVESFRLPRYPAAADKDEDEDGYGYTKRDELMTRTGAIETQWRTRRHKGSCRTLCYSYDGEVLFSSGTDGLIKAASPTTGQVHSKVRIPSPTPTPDAPTLLHALSPQNLLLATDSGLLHLYDLRLSTTTTANLLPSKPSQSHQPHDDYVSSLTPLPPTVNSTSGFSKQWISTGATTLALTDLRRGVLAKSVDQEEELLSSVSIDGFPRLAVGSTNGVLSLWEKGAWDDEIERIRVCQKGGTQSLDVLVAVPTDVRTGANVAVGVGDGSIAVVKLGENRVTETLKHDEVEGVIGLGFDVEGRLVSGGGSVIKIWLDDSNLDDMCLTDSDSKEDTKWTDSEDSDSDKSLGSNNSDHVNRGRKARRKRRKQKAAPQMGNGIMKFKGLE